MPPIEDINIPEFVATVADQLAEANKNADQRLEETKDAPFLDLGDVQLQIAFTAEESRTTEGKLELKPWIASVGGRRSGSATDAIVHTVTVSLVPATVEPSDRMPSAKKRAGFRVRAALAEILLPEAREVSKSERLSAIRQYFRMRKM